MDDLPRRSFLFVEKNDTMLKWRALDTLPAGGGHYVAYYLIRIFALPTGSALWYMKSTIWNATFDFCQFLYLKYDISFLPVNSILILCINIVIVILLFL